MKNTVLLTGASGGIGSAIAKVLAGSDFNLILCGNSNGEKVRALAEECTNRGSLCLAAQADLSQEKQVEDLFKKAVCEFGEVDMIINNAGISWWGLITDMTAEQWDRLFQVNVRSCFLTAKYGLPAMIQKKFGRIINIASMWGQVGASCEAAYSATKGAVIALTKALAKEVGPSGITVNCIAPGVIDTPMNASLSPETLQTLQGETPVNRLGQPQDIAFMVKYLLSSQASFITGQVIGINGGMVI